MLKVKFTYRVRTCQHPIESQLLVMQVCAEAGGGVVSTRDFVNLRHWALVDGVYISAGGSVNHPAMPPQVALNSSLRFYMHLQRSQPLVFSVEEGARRKWSGMLGDEAGGGSTWPLPIPVAAWHWHQGGLLSICCTYYDSPLIISGLDTPVNHRQGIVWHPVWIHCKHQSESSCVASWPTTWLHCSILQWYGRRCSSYPLTEFPWPRSHWNISIGLESGIIVLSPQPVNIKMHCPDKNKDKLELVWNVSCCDRRSIYSPWMEIHLWSMIIDQCRQ